MESHKKPSGLDEVVLVSNMPILVHVSFSDKYCIVGISDGAATLLHNIKEATKSHEI